MASRKSQVKAPEAKKAPDAKAPSTNWQRHLTAIGLIWVVALVAYGASFSGELVFDNRFLILSDARVQSVSAQNLGLIFGKEYWYGNSASDLYRPLTTLSYLFNFAILGNGTNPFGYHLINFALHAVNIALVYVLALWLLGEMQYALAMAGIWAVHPVLTESVTNVVGRADLLAAFGVLAALVCHIQSGRSQRRWQWIAGIAAVTAIGMFSKESAIVTVGVLVLYDVAFADRKTWRSRLVNYAAALVPSVLYLGVRAWVLSNSVRATIPFGDNPLVGTDFWTARLTALRIIGKYIGLLLWPASLSADYSYNEIPLFRAGDPAALLGLAVCLAVGVAGLWAFRRNRLLFFFVLLFFVTLSPVSNVFLLIGTIMAERFLYLPALAFAGCLVVLLRMMPQRLSPNAQAAIAAVICVAFVARTYTRNQDWATETALMTSASEVTPNASRPHVVLATLLRGDAAVAEADKARAILDSLPDDRNFLRAYHSVGISYRLQGDRVAVQKPAEALQWYRKSLDSLLRARKIERLYAQRNEEESRRHGIKNANFSFDAVYLDLARTYLALQRPAEALEALDFGLRLTPRPEFYYEELSNAYKQLGDPRKAEIAMVGGILLSTAETHLDPRTMQAYEGQLSAKLVEMYRASDPQSCAVTENRGRRSINMECPLVKDHLCTAGKEIADRFGGKNLAQGCGN